MRGVVASLIALSVAACYSPSYEDCAISCVNNGCPSGLECRAGACRTASSSGDCPVIGGDGGVDTNGDGPMGPMWSSPVMVTLSLTGVVDPSLTPDMLELYVMQSNVLYVSVRPSAMSQWPPLSQVNISGLPGIKDQTPSISADGLTLMFNSDRNGASAGQDIFVAMRPTRPANNWTSPMTVQVINSPKDDSGENMSFDMKTLVFASTRANNLLDIYSASRQDIAAPWGNLIALATLNDAVFNDGHPFISPDLLTIYFQSNRNGTTDLFTAHRASTSVAFDPPAPIMEIDTANFSEGDPWVSPDGHHMFFSSNRDGMSAIYETTR